MRLLSFRVTKFRNIVDSGEVKVDSPVTSFVGKNEAGKTALLEALYLLNPIHKTAPVLYEQYPRWLLSRDRKVGSIEEHCPISAKFLLEKKDSEFVEKYYGSGILFSNEVSVSRAYDGQYHWHMDCDQSALAKYLAANLSQSLQPHFSKVESLIEFREQLKHLKDTALSSEELDMIAARLDTDAEFDDSSPRAEDLEQISNDLHSLGLEHGKLEDGIGKRLIERLPKFFLFTQYSILPGRINLTELAYGGEDKTDDPNIQTAKSLIRLAGTEVSELRNEDYELRRSELEAVGIDLSREVNKYWKQNPHLEVSIDIDRVNVQHGDKSISVPRYLEVRLKDKRTGYSNNFSQRSSGFQWFFSFLAAFSEFEPGDTPIVLLDEPAVRLHGKSQEDFLSFIHEKLADASQVFYTTHSPFMVQAGPTSRTKIVEDLGPPDGSVVLLEPQLSNNSASLYPLRVAVANEIAQNMFAYPHNLVVEELSDFLLLTGLSSLCRADCREFLDERWELTPIGNSFGFAITANLTTDTGDIHILCTSESKGFNSASAFLDDADLKKVDVHSLMSLTNTSSNSLEDLFTTGDYLKLLNKAINLKLKAADIEPNGNILSEIQAKLNHSFDKALVAKEVLRGDITLTKTTLEKFEALFNKLNALLP